MEASLEIQRESDNIVNAITADTAGRFPDQTVAGALSRLPGIGVQRDQGQERYVQVRGAPTRWTVVSFDGINVLGAEERIFRFDRSEEHTSELQSLMRISYAVFCLKKKTHTHFPTLRTSHLQHR